MHCRIAGSCASLRVRLDKGPADVLPWSIMADTNDFFDFLRITAVGAIADNYLIILLERDFFGHPQQQTAAGLIGDDATPGSHLRGREGPEVSIDVGLLSIILPKLEVGCKDFRTGTVDPDRVFVLFEAIHRKGLYPAATPALDSYHLSAVDKIFLNPFRIHNVPPRVAIDKWSSYLDKSAYLYNKKSTLFCRGPFCTNAIGNGADPSKSWGLGIAGKQQQAQSAAMPAGASNSRASFSRAVKRSSTAP